MWCVCREGFRRGRWIRRTTLPSNTTPRNPRSFQNIHPTQPNPWIDPLRASYHMQSSQVCMLTIYTIRDATTRDAILTCAKSSYRSVDPQTLHENVYQVDHVSNGPTNSAAITTMFPLRLCGGKLLVAVTRERRYDDDDETCCLAMAG